MQKMSIEESVDIIDSENYKQLRRLGMSDK